MRTNVCCIHLGGSMATCEFLHTPQQYEAFSTFFTLTGCFSAFIFGGFVVMWFSSGGRCLYYVSAHVRLIWLILRVFFGTQGRMAYSLAWWQLWPDIWEQTQHSNGSSVVCVWCAVSCICCWDLLPCPLLRTLRDTWWKYFLVLPFRRSLNCEVSLMCISVWRVSGFTTLNSVI